MMTNEQADKIKRDINLGKIEKYDDLPREIQSALRMRKTDTESGWIVDYPRYAQYRLGIINYRRLAQRIGLLDENNKLTRMANKLRIHENSKL